MYNYELNIVDSKTDKVVKTIRATRKRELVNKAKRISLRSSNRNRYTVELINKNFSDKVAFCTYTPRKIKFLAQSLGVAMEKEELARAILNWEPKLKNVKQWLDAVKHSDTWKDIKSIWDALWRTKEDMPDKEEQKTTDYTEWVDFDNGEDEDLELDTEEESYKKWSKRIAMRTRSQQPFNETDFDKFYDLVEAAGVLDEVEKELDALGGQMFLGEFLEGAFECLEIDPSKQEMTEGDALHAVWTFLNKAVRMYTPFGVYPYPEEKRKNGWRQKVMDR